MTRAICRRRPTGVALLLLFLANAAVLGGQSATLRWSASYLLAGAIPGLLLVALLYQGGYDDEPIVRLVLGLGLGYVCLVLGGLLLNALPGPLAPALVVGAYDLLTLALLLVLRAKGMRMPPWHALKLKRWLALLGILAIAAYFRFASLGYSEFQGDEVAVLHKAAASIQGRDDALFLHKKGPAEIIVLLVPYAATGVVNEPAARLASALAGTIAVAGIYLLARRSLSRKAAEWSALLLALNGFGVAFGRIAQYQSLVLLFSVLGLWSALRFYDRYRRSDLWLSASFLSLGLLSHTDAAFAVLPAGLLIVKAFSSRQIRLRAALRLMAPAMLGACGVLAFHFVPLMLHPQFEATREYLGWRSGRLPFSNLRQFRDIATTYNAIYYVGLVALVLSVGIVARLRRLGRPAWLWPAVVIVLVVVCILWPELWLIGGRNYLGLAFLGVLAAGYLAGDEGVAWRSFYVWFAVPLLLYLFWFRDPRTHYYIVFPGAALLVARELERLEARLSRVAWLPRAVAMVLLLFSAAYLQVVFVEHSPEYIRTYPRARIRLFSTPYHDAMPEQGLFGFPYRAGWKTVGWLYQTGVLQGDYGTNEETHITRWYTRGAVACGSQPRYYFLAEDVQDVQSVPLGEVSSKYERIGRVLVGEQVKLVLYERRPARLSYTDYRASEIEQAFDRQASGPQYDAGLPLFDGGVEIQHPMALSVGPSIDFLGFALDEDHALPGESVNLTLYWRAREPISDALTVFAHVEDPGVVWAQKDNPPCCEASCPTSSWQPGRIYADRYSLVLGKDVPPGPHALVAGMYRPSDGERLPVYDAVGAPAGDTLGLGAIEVLQR